MKKLKLLFGFSLVLISFILFHFFSQFFFFERISARLLENTNYDSVLQKPSWWTLQVASLIILISVWFINRGLWSGIKNGLFKNKAALHLNTGAILWLIVSYYSLMSEIVNIINHGLTSENKVTITVSFLMLIMGYSLLFFVDVLKKGIYLKQENDLTI